MSSVCYLNASPEFDSYPVRFDGPNSKFNEISEIFANPHPGLPTSWSYLPCSKLTFFGSPTIFKGNVDLTLT